MPGSQMEVHGKGSLLVFRAMPDDLAVHNVVILEQAGLSDYLRSGLVQSRIRAAGLDAVVMYISGE